MKYFLSLVALSISILFANTMAQTTQLKVFLETFIQFSKEHQENVYAYKEKERFIITYDETQSLQKEKAYLKIASFYDKFEAITHFTDLQTQKAFATPALFIKKESKVYTLNMRVNDANETKELIQKLQPLYANVSLEHKEMLKGDYKEEKPKKEVVKKEVFAKEPQPYKTLSLMPEKKEETQVVQKKNYVLINAEGARGYSVLESKQKPLKLKPLEEVSPKTPEKKYTKNVVIEIDEPKDDGIDVLKNIVFSTDNSLNQGYKNFRIKQKYDLKVQRLDSIGSLDVVQKLQNSRINTGIVRGDVLGIKKNALYGFDAFANYGIVCAQSSSVLYMIAKRKIKSIYEMRGMTIATGKVTNLAQIYLSDMARNSGISLNINYTSLEFEAALEALAADDVDMIFMFGPTSYVRDAVEKDFIVSSFTPQMKKLLQKRQGLLNFTYKIDKERIATYKVPNYVIAPLVTLDTEIAKKIKALVDTFACYKRIQNIDPFYGQLHPEVKNAIAQLRAEEANLNNKGSVKLSLINVKKEKGDTKYFFQLQNSYAQDVNVTFDYYKTKLFDSTAFKPRHVLDVFPKGKIEVKANNSRLVSFIYKNNFTTRIKQSEISLIFQDLTNKSTISVPLEIGDL